MPVFDYKGVTAEGKKVSGVLDGDSLKFVKTKLKKEGVVVLEIHEGSAARAAARETLSYTFGSRVKLGDLANATRQLATLLSSGLPLMDSLSVLVEQEEVAPLKSALSSVRDSVREGSSLADALKENPKVFSQLYMNMVSAGEASGTLEIALDRLADFLDEQVRFRGRIAAALAYPAFMTVIGMGMLLFIFSFVMPRVVGMFRDMKQQLPLGRLPIHYLRRRIRCTGSARGRQRRPPAGAQASEGGPRVRVGILGVRLFLRLAVRGPGAARAITGSLLLVVLHLIVWLIVVLGVGWVAWIVLQLPSHFRP